MGKGRLVMSMRTPWYGQKNAPRISPGGVKQRCERAYCSRMWISNGMPKLIRIKINSPDMKVPITDMARQVRRYLMLPMKPVFGSISMAR